MAETPDNLPAVAPAVPALQPETQPDILIDVDRKPTSQKVLPPGLYARRARGIKTTEITESMIDTFLEELEKTGLWETSAQRAGLNLRTINKLIKLDCDFKSMTEQAMKKYIETLEQECHRRAVEGWDEPVFSHKECCQIGTIKKFDGKLLELMLKRHDKGYAGTEQPGSNTTVGVIVVPASPINIQAFLAEGQKQPTQFIESKPVEPPALPEPPAKPA